MCSVQVSVQIVWLPKVGKVLRRCLLRLVAAPGRTATAEPYERLAAPCVPSVPAMRTILFTILLLTTATVLASRQRAR